jgi:RNA polymerase sigma-70 factor (ECF subfamily)
MGDAAAFADLYERMAPRIYALVQRVVRDPHQSEEVTQEVFLQVWQGAVRFDARRGSALSWLMTIAHRRAVDRVRHSEGRRRRDASDAERGRELPYDVTESAAHASLEGEQVRAALATLSPIQRQAVELAYFGGYTHREVSGLLQIPLGTAKSRIRDGLLRLRGLLSPPTPEAA